MANYQSFRFTNQQVDIIKKFKSKNMKDILKPYLNMAVRINAQYSGMSLEFKLVKVEENYFGIIDSTGDESFFRYIPYSSVSEITERKNTLTIKIHNCDELMELLGNMHYALTEDLETKMDSLKEEIQALKEETINLKGGMISIMVPLGEIMRTSSDIKKEMIEITKEIKSTNQQISSLENTVRFNSRIP